eukprot:CAMPEP_0206384968 /NCGR_PEP_ID=MMETSP0294-20121207/14936_1 /ASSEMBLY_ACC=CAM_ASM_000327 /TAXON_ID=39354 /ORGANISM="Heterosigma akashiwo, Strain CCMP2393" /LENGTH=253 /DNA_ID=CAMNT_0053835471 /DNA_START=73 /DNA_END=834 /DNA_ORIENTATION=+
MCREHKLVGQTADPSFQHIKQPKRPNANFKNADNPFPGWERELSWRASGTQAGKADVYYRPPGGKKLRSRPDVTRHFENHLGTGVPDALMARFSFTAQFCTCGKVLKDGLDDQTMVPCTLGAGGCNGMVHPICVSLKDPVHISKIKEGKQKFVCSKCQEYKNTMLPALQELLNRQQQPFAMATPAAHLSSQQRMAPDANTISAANQPMPQAQQLLQLQQTTPTIPVIQPPQQDISIAGPAAGITSHTGNNSQQ